MSTGSPAVLLGPQLSRQDGERDRTGGVVADNEHGPVAGVGRVEAAGELVRVPPGNAEDHEHGDYGERDLHTALP